MKMKNVTMDQKGFSLVEILIAMTIFAVGLLALAGMQITAIQGNTFSGTTTDGIRLAQDHIEQLMPLTYSSLTTDASLVDTDGDGDGGLNDATVATADFSLLNQAQNNYNYDVFWNLSDGSVISNTKTISVIVAWTENGRQRTVSVQGVRPRIN